MKRQFSVEKPKYKCNINFKLLEISNLNPFIEIHLHKSEMIIKNPFLKEISV